MQYNLPNSKAVTKLASELGNLSSDVWNIVQYTDDLEGKVASYNLDFAEVVTIFSESPFSSKCSKSLKCTVVERNSRKLLATN